MAIIIRELRDKTGLTQKEFAERYSIPVSTLRKWEQGEANPAPYFVNLLAQTLPATDGSLQTVKYKNTVFYYDQEKRTVLDQLGNSILTQEDLEGVKKQNLGLYLHDLFEEFYRIQERFNQDCRYDKEEDILWS